MGKITKQNRRKLEGADTYEKADLEGMLDCSIAEELDALFRKKGVRASRIADITGISKSYINDLRNPRKNGLHPHRDKVINICLAAGADLDTINTILKKARMQELYTRDRADSVIIWGLLHGKSYAEIRAMLAEQGCTEILEGKDP